MSEKIKIEKIVLKIGQEKINLTIEEAKELKEELLKLFGDSKPSYYPIYIEKQFPAWPYPTIYPTVTYSDTHTGTQTSTNFTLT